MQPSKSVRSLALALSATLAISTAGRAQGWSSPPPPAADSAARSRPLFTLRDAIVAAGFAGLTVAMFPLDQHIARRLENPGTQANHFFHHAATGFEVIASPGAARRSRAAPLRGSQ